MPSSSTKATPNKARWFKNDPNRNPEDLTQIQNEIYKRRLVRDPDQKEESSDGSQVATYLISGVLILFVGIAVLLSIPKNSKVSQQKTSQTKLTQETALHPIPLSIAENFTQATDPNERLKWCRDSERMTELIPSFPVQAVSEVPASLKKFGQVSTDSNLSFHRFIATFSNGDRRLLSVVNTHEGPRVDWETYARHTSAEWSDILNGTKERALVRVFINPINYYNYHYQDESKWTSFRLTSPDVDTSISGYCPKDSPVSKQLQKLRPKQRVTLRLNLGQAMVDSRQCEIGELIAVGWTLVSEEPQHLTPSLPFPE